MSLAECITILLVGLACIVNSTAILKIGDENLKTEKEIKYLFDWLSEVQRKTDKLDAIIQRIEKE